MAGQDPENAVRGTLHPVRICFQALTTSVVPLDAEPPRVAELQSAIEADAVARRQGHFHAPFPGRFSGADKSVVRDERRVFSLPNRNRLDACVRRRLREIPELVPFRTFDFDGITDPRIESGQRS